MFKKFLVHPFKDRTLAYYLGFAAALFAIISSVLLMALDGGDKTCSVSAFVLMLVGGFTFVGTMFLNSELLPFIPVVLYIAGFACELDATLPSLSDVWNGVNFIGGNAYMGLAFTCIFALCAIMGIVSNFMKYRKSIKQLV